MIVSRSSCDIAIHRYSHPRPHTSHRSPNLPLDGPECNKAYRDLNAQVRTPLAAWRVTSVNLPLLYYFVFTPCPFPYKKHELDPSPNGPVSGLSCIWYTAFLYLVPSILYQYCVVLCPLPPIHPVLTGILACFCSCSFTLAWIRHFIVWIPLASVTFLSPQIVIPWCSACT